MILLSPFVVFIYFGLALLLYHSTVYGLYDLWVLSDSGTYTHGVLLLGVSIYFFYKTWLAERNALSVQPNTIGFVFLVSTSIAWFLVALADVAVMEEILLVFIFLFIVWAIFGYKNALKFSFPILLIICAIPVWDILQGVWLQKATAEVATIMLKAIGINSYRDGVYIHIPAGKFQVAETCSGMRQLVAAISLGFIYGYMNNFRIVALFAYTFLIAIVSFFINSIRIFIVVIAGELTEMQHYFVRKDHVTLGWVLFGIGIFLFIWLSNVVLRASHKDEVAVETISEGKCEASEKPRHQYLVMVLVLLGLSTGPALAFFHSINKNEWKGSLVIPSVFDDWQLKSKEGDYRPHFINGDVVYEGIYENSAKETVYCYVGYFWDQEQGRELIASFNTVEDKGKWKKVSSIQNEVYISGKKIKIQETLLKSSVGRKKLVWNWYVLAGNLQTSRPDMAKLFGIWGELIGKPGSASFLVATDVVDNESNARLRLKNFLDKSLVEVETAISQAPDSILN